MKLQKLVGILGATVLMGASALSLGSVKAHAIDESTFSTPMFTYGHSLNNEADNLKFTKSALGVTDAEGKELLNGVNETVVEPKDLMKYFPQVGFDETSGAWSSALIIPLEKGKGVSVQIKTPQNITVFTEAQYRNAIMDSGITDADVRIASATKVDGSGAMTGIYKAYDTTVEPKNAEEEAQRTEDREKSQETMNAVADVSKEMATGDEKTDAENDEKLNQAIAETKAQISEIASKQDELATKEDIQKMLDEALAKQGLSNVVNNNTVNNVLVPALEQFGTTSIAKDPNSSKQYSGLATQLEKGENDLSKFATVELGDKTVGMFKGFFEKIGNKFSGEGWNTNKEVNDKAVQEGINGLQENAKSFTGDATDSVKDGVEKGKDAVNNALNNENVDKAKEQTKGLWQKTKDFFSNLFGGKDKEEPTYETTTYETTFETGLLEDTEGSK